MKEFLKNVLVFFLTIKQIMKIESFTGFFKGFGVTIFRDISFSIIYFSSYEGFKWIQNYISIFPEVLRHLISGAGAGAIGTIVTIPIDVVKTRLQTQFQLPKGERLYSGMIDAFRTIYKVEGKKALVRGLGPRLAQTIPAASITFASYEQYTKLLKKYNLW